MIISISSHGDGVDMRSVSGTPDEVSVTDYVDFIAGFQVVRISDANHNGFKALQFALADSFGSREVGRLVVRTDVPFREQCLEWTRYFEDPDKMEDFIAAYEQTKDLPAGFVPIEARKLDVHDVVIIDDKVTRIESFQIVINGEAKTTARLNLYNVWELDQFVHETAPALVEHFVPLEELVPARHDLVDCTHDNMQILPGGVTVGFHCPDCGYIQLMD